MGRRLVRAGRRVVPFDPRRLVDRSTSAPSDPYKSSFLFIVCFEYSFQSEAPAELSLSEGDLVRVHASGGVGWVVATLLVPNDDDDLIETGQQGLVPLGYLTSAPQ